MRVLVQIGSTDMRVPDASYNSQAWSCVPDCRRSWALIAETSQAELPLADTVHQLDTGDRICLLGHVAVISDDDPRAVQSNHPHSRSLPHCRQDERRHGQKSPTAPNFGPWKSQRPKDGSDARLSTPSLRSLNCLSQSR